MGNEKQLGPSVVFLNLESQILGLVLPDHPDVMGLGICWPHLLHLFI